MNSYDEWKLQDGFNHDDSFQEEILVSGDNPEDFNLFEDELNELLDKYGYKRG